MTLRHGFLPGSKLGLPDLPTSPSLNQSLRSLSVSLPDNTRQSTVKSGGFLQEQTDSPTVKAGRKKGLQN